MKSKIPFFTEDDEDMPLNLSTKNRQIWSPGSACEREKDVDSPILKWEQSEEADAPLELVKRCRSTPDRSPSLSPRRCPSAPTYPPQHHQTDINFSLLIKNETRHEKSFQVITISIQMNTYRFCNIPYPLTDSDILRQVLVNCTVSVQNGLK